MIEFQFKDIPENGSLAGQKVILPTPSGNKQTKIDTLPSEEPLFIEGATIEQYYNRYKALPWYKRFGYQVKYLWNRYV